MSELETFLISSEYKEMSHYHDHIKVCTSMIINYVYNDVLLCRLADVQWVSSWCKYASHSLVLCL